jgi:hypothetical protein
MPRHVPTRALAQWSAFAILVTGAAALPAMALPRDEGRASGNLANFSQAVAFHHWLGHPDQAPDELREKLRTLRDLRAAGAAATARTITARSVGRAFNADGLGLPQNEESITSCRGNPTVVLGSTNDYRGLLDPEGNFTGWHLSLDGGRTLTNEGLLPSIDGIPSGGDPVSVADAECALYGGSLNYDPVDPFHNPNGIGVYRSTAATLAGCPGASSPACWPTRRLVARSDPSHFLDKEWIDVGTSGEAGTVVWAVYTDFVIDDSAPTGFTSASINAVRCSADLTSCTDPILISGSDQDVQFSDVTIASDGRVYVTWSQIQGELEGTAQTFTHKLRIAEAGSTDFGTTQVIAAEDNAIPFGGRLHANDFRVATYPKNAVAQVGHGASAHPRVFVTWDACLARPLDTVCEEPVIKLVYSDDDGATWSPQRVVSGGGDNYFPTIATDRATGKVLLAWFTNRYDAVFHNRQDVDHVAVNAATGRVSRPERLTHPSNESEADPLLGGSFIGDYIEVFVHNHRALIHYNANYRSAKLLDGLVPVGVPVPQQDNFLIRHTE